MNDVRSKMLIDNISKAQEQTNREIERLQQQEIRFINATGMEIETVISLFLQGYKFSMLVQKNLSDYNFKTGKRKLVKRIKDAINAFNNEC